jgi:hypothetical protein
MNKLNIIKTILSESNTLYGIEIDRKYETLFSVLMMALEQAAYGKGKERHANNLPFIEQKICRINRSVGLGYSLGQSIKKIEETSNLTDEASIQELLGAINYTASAVLILLEKINDKK